MAKKQLYSPPSFGALQHPSVSRAVMARHGIKGSPVIQSVAGELVATQSVPVGLEDEAPAFRYPFFKAAAWSQGGQPTAALWVFNPPGSNYLAEVWWEVNQIAVANTDFFAVLWPGQLATPTGTAPLLSRDYRHQSFPLVFEWYRGVAGAPPGYGWAQRVGVANLRFATPPAVLWPGSAYVIWALAAMDAYFTAVGFCRWATDDELRAL